MAREICDLYELDGVDVDDFRIETERMVVYGHLKNEKSICHKCGSSHVIFNGFRNRECQGMSGDGSAYLRNFLVSGDGSAYLRNFLVTGSGLTF